MPRTGITADRMGARTRIGRVNDGIDHTPYIFQELGFMERVASPEEQKKGVLGYTARGVVTFDSLKKQNLDRYNSKMKDLETRKKEVPQTVGQILDEGKQILKKYADKNRQAGKLQDVIPFERVNESVKQYVDLKSNVVGSYENRMKQLQSSMASAQRYIDRVSDDRRGASGEERIRLNTQRREEQAYLEGLRREMNIIKQYKDKNMRDMRFGEDIRYYPFDQVSKYANEVGDVYFRNQSARIWNRHRNQIAQHRAEVVRKATEHLQSRSPQVTPFSPFMTKGEHAVRLAQLTGRV